MFRSWFGKSKSPKRASSRSPRPRQSFRPELDVLEERTLLSLASAVNLPVGQSPRAVVQADFDRDGKIDR